MDLTLTPELTAFRDEVRAFLAEHAAEHENGAPKDMKTWQKLLIDHGYAARTIPKEYGGYGAQPDILKSRIMAEAFIAANAPRGMSGQGIAMLVPTLLEVGSEEQKTRWIGPTLRGEVIWCQGYSEPGAGSDLANLQTKAVEDGEDFLISGSKIWTSTAMQAQMMFCLVRTEPKAAKHEGISYILFPMSTPGIDPHSTILPRYHSKQIPTKADCSGQNYTRFKNADVDKAIEEAGGTLDIEKRKAAYAKVMKALNDAYVIIWMYDRANIDARVTGLQGWQGNTWRRFTWNVQDWWIKK